MKNRDKKVFPHGTVLNFPKGHSALKKELRNRLRDVFAILRHEQETAVTVDTKRPPAHHNNHLQYVHQHADNYVCHLVENR